MSNPEDQPQEPPQRNPHEAIMPLGEHLEELRARLIRCILTFSVGFVVGWIFRDRILAFLIAPHSAVMARLGLEPTINYRSYLEPLYAQVMAVAIAAVMLVFPYLLYQLWGFVAPGLLERERRWVRGAAVFSLALFFGGMVFGYLVLLPLGMRFLVMMAGPGTEPVIMIRSYFSFLFVTTLFLGIAFQTPLVVYSVVRLGIVSSEAVRNNRKLAIAAAFVLGAVLTPPDPFTQVMVALPMVLLFDVGLILAAPTRANIVSFFKFAGLIVLALGIIAGYFLIVPIARHRPSGRPLYRQGRVEAPADKQVRLELGRIAGAHVRLGPGAAVQLIDAAELKLLRGRVLITAGPKSDPVSVDALEAKITVRDAVAEVALQGDYQVTVTAVEGTVRVDAGEREVSLQAGRRVRLTLGGESADLDALRERWAPEEGDRAE